MELRIRVTSNGKRRVQVLYGGEELKINTSSKLPQYVAFQCLLRCISPGAYASCDLHIQCCLAEKVESVVAQYERYKKQCTASHKGVPLFEEHGTERAWRLKGDAVIDGGAQDFEQFVGMNSERLSELLLAQAAPNSARDVVSDADPEYALTVMERYVSALTAMRSKEYEVAQKELANASQLRPRVTGDQYFRDVLSMLEVKVLYLRGEDENALRLVKHLVKNSTGEGAHYNYRLYRRLGRYADLQELLLHGSLPESNVPNGPEKFPDPHYELIDLNIKAHTYRKAGVRSLDESQPKAALRDFSRAQRVATLMVYAASVEENGDCIQQAAWMIARLLYDQHVAKQLLLQNGGLLGNTESLLGASSKWLHVSDQACSNLCRGNDALLNAILHARLASAAIAYGTDDLQRRESEGYALIQLSNSLRALHKEGSLNIRRTPVQTLNPHEIGLLLAASLLARGVTCKLNCHDIQRMSLTDAEFRKMNPFNASWTNIKEFINAPSK